MGEKNFLVKKSFSQKVFLGKQNFWVEDFFGQKFFGVKNILWVKINFGLKKIFGSKKICIRKCLSKKKQVGLTQWGGYMTPPPPPENSRVKIVLDCC